MDVINWMLQSAPWVEVNTRHQLMRQPLSNESVIAARQAMLSHAAVQNLINEVNGWPGTPLISHKSAGHLLHKLVFLADIGVNKDDDGIGDLILRIMENQDSEGPFEVLTNIPKQFGGDGLDGWAWALCDAPSLLYVLAKFGMENDQRVKQGIDTLVNLVRENGWPCTGSTKYGTFRGPGKKIDPCPYANLLMLKLLATMSEMIHNDAAKTGCESLLTCWAERQTRHPYIFYMGNDFCKLKAPLVWYDLLHVLDVLSRFEWVRQDARYLDMRSVLAAKADGDGRFTPESVWLAWKEWDFGQKKEPSPWLTYLATRILST